MGAAGKFSSATIGSVLLLPHNPAEQDCINKNEETIYDSFMFEKKKKKEKTRKKKKG